MKKLLLAAALMAAAPVFAQNLAVVNGTAIPSSRVDQFVQLLERQGQTDTPELREQIRDELITREVFLQEARRRGIDTRDEITTEVELARQGIVIRALFADFEANEPVSDADVQAEYERVKAAQSGQEFRARHILVETEAEARDLIGRIKGGENFETLATTASKDPGSAQNGGDLDWAPADAYVEPFAQALNGLQPGQLTEEPVQTQFGWHIIRLEEVRESPFPELAEVRPQIEQMLRQQKLREFQTQLRESARIE